MKAKVTRKDKLTQLGELGIKLVFDSRTGKFSTFVKRHNEPKGTYYGINTVLEYLLLLANNELTIGTREERWTVLYSKNEKRVGTIKKKVFYDVTLHGKTMVVTGKGNNLRSNRQKTIIRNLLGYYKQFQGLLN